MVAKIIYIFSFLQQTTKSSGLSFGGQFVSITLLTLKKENQSSSFNISTVVVHVMYITDCCFKNTLEHDKISRNA